MTVETKFNIGDEVWFMYKLKPICERVTSLTIYTCNKLVIEYFFEVPFVFIREEKLFSTKQELLDSL